MAAAYLVSTGLTPDQAWALIRKTRPFVNPTPPQLAVVEQFASEQLRYQEDSVATEVATMDRHRQG